MLTSPASADTAALRPAIALITAAVTTLVPSITGPDITVPITTSWSLVLVDYHYLLTKG